MIALAKSLLNPSGLVIVVLLFLAGLTAGVRVTLWKVEADQAGAARIALATQQAHARHADRVAAQVAEAQTRIEYRTRTIIKEVPVYVTQKADGACTLTRGFVELFNASAEGRMPAPALDADAPAAGLALSDVAYASAENHDAYYQCRSELEGWQRWWKGVSSGGE